MTVLGIVVLGFLAIWLLVSYFRPPLAFVLMIVLYPLKQVEQTYLPFFVTNSALFNIIVGFCVLAAALGSISRNRRAIADMWGPFTATLVLLFLFAVASLVWSPSQKEAIGILSAGLPYWLMQVLLIPIIFATARDYRSTLGPTLLIASIVAVLFLTNPLGVFVNARYVLKLGSGYDNDFGNPLASAQMGGQMAFIAALTIARKTSLPWLLARIAALVLGLALAVEAGSRGQLLASVFLIVTMYPVARKVRDIKQFFLTAAGFGLMVSIAYLTIVVILSGDHGESSRWDLTLASEHTSERTREILLLMNWWWERPQNWVFGLGANAFTSIPGVGQGYVHNAVVELLCEYGFFGLGTFCALAFMTFRHSRELFRRHSEDPELRSAVAVLIAFGLYSFLLSLKQGAFLGSPEPYCFWLLIVKINCSERYAEQSYQAQLAEHEAYYAGGALPGYEDVAAAYSNTGNA
jgi:hypothetical protein